MTAGYPVGGDINSGNITRGIYRYQYNQKAGIRQTSSVVYVEERRGERIEERWEGKRGGY